MGEPTIMRSALQDSKYSKAIFYGDPCWSLRNDRLRTPPGPEGSNGSSYIMCRGVADRGSHHFSPLKLLPPQPKSNPSNASVGYSWMCLINQAAAVFCSFWLVTSFRLTTSLDESFDSVSFVTEAGFFCFS